MEYTEFFSDRVKPLKGSAIREMFKRMADPEIISLAGGNPASELIVIAGMMIEEGGKLEDFRKYVFPHPTEGERFREF